MGICVGMPDIPKSAMDSVLIQLFIRAESTGISLIHQLQLA